MKAMIDFAEKYVPLTVEDRDLLSQLSQSSWQIQAYKKGDVIKPAQAAMTDALFVFEGALCVSFLHHDELMVSEFFFTGDPVVLPQPDFHLEVYCLRDTKIGRSLLNDVEGQLQMFPKFERVCRLFAEDRLNQRSQFSDMLKSSSPLEKYEFVFSHRRELIDQVPHRLLARYLGITPETLSRVRRQFVNVDLDLNQ